MTRRPRPKSEVQNSIEAAINENGGAAMVEKPGEKEVVLRLFAKISSPENREVFSVRSVIKAFAHIKVT